MKINEVITESLNEGPIWQGIKAGAKGLGNMWQGAKAGYQQGQGQEEVNDSAKVSIQQWNQLAGQLNQAGTPPTVQQLQAFVKKQAPTAQQQPPTDLSNPTAVNDYITKSVAQHISNQKLGQSQGQQQGQQQGQAPAQGQQQGQQPAQGQQQAAEPIEPTMNPEPAQQQAPAKASANDFAQKLKADVDQFVNAGGGLGAPAVKSLLKDLWMQAGGVKAENKKINKKSV